MNTTMPSCEAEHSFSGDDEMVECEWEAVEALACLSYSVTADNTEQLSHTREQAIDIQSEDESELKTSPQCALNYPPVTSSKARQESTEEEKEGQRLRRVLANRESARRTIRRRQAMQEELTRKAADLALENENLKKNKELAAAEYNSLKNKNNSLKAQMAKTVKAEVQTNDESSMLPPVEIPTTSTTSPTFLHNQSSTAPFFISTAFQPLEGLVLQSGSQSISAITPQLPTIGEFKPSHKIESAMMMNSPGTPLYVLSFPWMMSFHTQSTSFHTQSSHHNDQQQTSFLHGCSTSTSQTTVNVENHVKATPLKVETETPDSIGTTHRDFLHEAENDFRSHEGASKGMIHATATSIPFVRPVIGRQSDSTQQDNTPNVKVFAHAARLAVDTSTQMYQGCVTCSSNLSSDAIVAAEARRRRKELLKLKGQHCHPFRVI